MAPSRRRSASDIHPAGQCRVSCWGRRNISTVRLSYFAYIVLLLVAAMAMCMSEILNAFRQLLPLENKSNNPE